MIAYQVFKMFSSPIIEDQDSKNSGSNGSNWDGTATPKTAHRGQGGDNSQQHVMTYDDFLALYVAFKEKKDEEMLQVIFHLLKVSPDHVANRSLEEPQEGVNWPM